MSNADLSARLESADGLVKAITALLAVVKKQQPGPPPIPSYPAGGDLNPEWAAYNQAVKRDYEWWNPIEQASAEVSAAAERCGVGGVPPGALIRDDLPGLLERLSKLRTVATVVAKARPLRSLRELQTCMTVLRGNHSVREYLLRALPPEVRRDLERAARKFPPEGTHDLFDSLTADMMVDWLLEHRKVNESEIWERPLADVAALLTAARTESAGAARTLNETQRSIVRLCRRKALKGEVVASRLGLSYEYIRHVLAHLVKTGHLRNTDNGYLATM
jgi:hypothetical protein